MVGAFFNTNDKMAIEVTDKEENGEEKKGAQSVEQSTPNVQNTEEIQKLDSKHKEMNL